MSHARCVRSFTVHELSMYRHSAGKISLLYVFFLFFFEGLLIAVNLLPSRWVHAVCESLYTEDEVEQASDEGFACTSCTPYAPKPAGEPQIYFNA